jgi:endonuclease III-like uncharacterized protein
MVSELSKKLIQRTGYYKSKSSMISLNISIVLMLILAESVKNETFRK